MTKRHPENILATDFIERQLIGLEKFVKNENSNDITNNVFNCDNLELLKKINDNSIDLIYCDILYNTGRIFSDYSDKFESTDAAIDFYKPRFIEMKRVLKETGLIYIQCDYNLSYYIKILMDKIFDIKNFRNEIIWWYNSAARKKKDFESRHDTIFRYSKTNDYFFNENSIYIREEYSKSAPRGYAKEKYYNPNGKIMDDVWRIPILGQNDKTERIGYSTQKPLSLLYKIIDSSCPINGIVADFFMGSGTTCIAAKQLNRNFVGCDISKRAIEVFKKRLLRGN